MMWMGLIQSVKDLNFKKSGRNSLPGGQQTFALSKMSITYLAFAKMSLIFALVQIHMA